MNGRLVLCCGMPRSASTLQYQLAVRASERGGTTRACGWYSGEPLPDLIDEIPAGETWIYKVHRYSASYRFEEAAATGHVLALATQRDVRAVVASYRQLHDRTMWWVARHRVLEGLIDDFRAWSKADGVLVQTYDELTSDGRAALLAISRHLGVELDEATTDAVVAEVDRSAQAKRTATRLRHAAGTSRPEDLLQPGHVSSLEREVSPNLDTAWVESVAGPWLRAYGSELITTRKHRALARARHAPRWIWFLRWHLQKRTLGSAAASRARLARSWTRHQRVRFELRRFIARRSLARIRARWWPGSIANTATTVVVVAWDSADIIEDTIRFITRFSPVDTQIIVVDNASTDNTVSIANSHENVRVISLTENVGHGLAMDLGFLAARTEFCIALDVDAFPIRDGWIETLRERLEAGATVAGAEWTRSVGFYIHPCCLMMRRSTFVLGRHSFEPRILPGVNPAGLMGQRFWDAGERISMREGTANLAPFPMTSCADFMVGMVFGDFVYHNGATSRAADSDTWADSGGAERALSVWKHAVARYDPGAPLELDSPIELDEGHQDSDAGAISPVHGTIG